MKLRHLDEGMVYVGTLGPYFRVPSKGSIGVTIRDL